MSANCPHVITTVPVSRTQLTRVGIAVAVGHLYYMGPTVKRKSSNPAPQNGGATLSADRVNVMSTMDSTRIVIRRLENVGVKIITISLRIQINVYPVNVSHWDQQASSAILSRASVNANQGSSDNYVIPARTNMPR